MVQEQTTRIICVLNGLGEMKTSLVSIIDHENVEHGMIQPMDRIEVIQKYDEVQIVDMRRVG